MNQAVNNFLYRKKLLRLWTSKQKNSKSILTVEDILFEGLKNNDDIFDGKFGQTLVSVLHPGIVKGWHRHWKQTDYTLCAKGKLKYCISDGKEVKCFIIGEDNPMLIKTPPGLWHGYKAVDGEAIIFHVMDKAYNPKNEDTERLDPDAFGDVWN